MRLGADQLSARLKRSGLSPIYFISGDEPLQMMECVDEIRSFTRAHHFDERIVFDANYGFDWNELLETGSSMSLFSTRRLLELHLGRKSPGNEGGQVLIRYASQAPPDDVLVVTAKKLDKKTQQTKWYRALADTGVTIQIKAIEPDQLPGWISLRVQKHGKQISIEAARLIAERIEGNLLAASQEIERLCLLIDNNEIDVDEVLTAVVDNSRFDVFALIENALSGNIKRTVHMLKGLQEEGIDPMAIYGALMWEFRRLCSMSCRVRNGVPADKLLAEFRVWEESRQQAIIKTLQQHSAVELHAMLRVAVKIERMIKSADRVLVWDMFQSLLLELAGYPLSLKGVK